MKQNIIFGNYGNETVALVAYAIQQKLSNVVVVSVETGWAANNWQQRIDLAEKYIKDQGLEVYRIKAKQTFASLIEQRADFPSIQYQWCAGFLKALPFLDWLDEHDPRANGVVLLGNRRALAKRNATLPEYIKNSEHFGERKIWHPLYLHSDSEIRNLVAQTGLDYLPHRSLECDPCVNNSAADFLRLEEADVAKTKSLEKNISKHMFSDKIYGNSEGIEKVINWVEKNSESDKLSPLDMGCGSSFGCGL